MRLRVDRGDGLIEMTLEEFFALSLRDRIHVILRERIQFFDEASNPIPLTEGLKRLRDNTPDHLRG